MPGSCSFSAVLLAAGRSTRMGRDKALLEIGGLPLWHRQRDVLARAGAAEIFLSARPVAEQPWVAEALARGGFAAVLHDALPSAGPLCGVTAAIERAAPAHVAVLAVDLPRMTADWFLSLAAECTPASGAVGRNREGFFEPLAAIYPAEIKWLAWEALARGDNSLQHLLAAAVAQGLMRVHEITASEAAWFENWNAPASAAPPTAET